MFAQDEIYSISKFIQLCAKTINNIPVVWVSGEVSNLSTPNSGHIYFSLKDKKSQLRCALFKLSRRNLKFNLENGQQIMARGAPSLYEIRGDFQLIIERIEAIGVGSLELGFKQLQQKLKTQGLFAQECKKNLPSFPKNIGIITSKTGAVIQDIIKILAKKYPFATVIIYDTPTQGDSAITKIIDALQIADNSQICDVLIIARGGGSSEDLWCFNDEDLALAIFNAKTPIISGIGHQTDTTIIDFVADICAPTPSAAAMMVVPDKLEILQNQDNLNKRLKGSIIKNISYLNQILLDFNQRLSQPNFYKNYQLIDNLNIRLINLVKNNIRLKKLELKTIYTRVLGQNPVIIIAKNQINNNNYKKRLMLIKVQIKTKNSLLNSLKTTMLGITKNNLVVNKNHLTKNITGLNHLNPLGVLARGYSITSIKNSVIHSIKNVNNDDEIITQLTDGKIKSIVLK